MADEVDERRLRDGQSGDAELRLGMRAVSGCARVLYVGRECVVRLCRVC